MGQEIDADGFTDKMRETFRARLRAETATLKGWFDARAFDFAEGFTAGLELEGWLIDENAMPAPQNEAFLAAADHPLIVPELSKFNFELNAAPAPLRGSCLSAMGRDLADLWGRADRAAAGLGLRPIAVGILPTVRDAMLQPEWMSTSNRYRALNDELFRLRKDKPLHIRIDGEDRLDYRAGHIMLEAACTSLQTHLKINQEDAPAFWNASVLSAGPLVAASANAPFLYGRSLWAETRIAAFENATECDAFRDHAGREMRRVTLGSGFVRHSLLELFVENLAYPTLLPALSDDAARLPRLKLQNGTLWRWCRPILGYEDDGTPHLRIEQRVMAAGPSIDDMIAHLALSFGLALHLARAGPADAFADFETARANFYACAREGLNARVTWKGRRVDVQALLLHELLPAARAALAAEGVDEADLERYVDHVLRPRMISGLNGARWQRSFVRRYGRDFQALTEAYAERQASGAPVHAWTV